MASITIETNGQILVVSSATENSAAVTVYSDSGLQNSVTLPAVIAADTTYYTADGAPGSFVDVVVTQQDGTVLGSRGYYRLNRVAGNAIKVSPTPSEFQSAGDLLTYPGHPVNFAENFPRALAAVDGAALTTQVMSSVAIPLRKGQVITKIGFLSGGTGAGTPTNWWFALYTPAGALMAQTADQTSTAWAANTAKEVSLATAQTLTYSGLYYAAVMVKATTPPTLRSVTSSANAYFPSTLPKLSVTSGSSLTDTAPATIGTPTASAVTPYVWTA